MGDESARASAPNSAGCRTRADTPFTPPPAQRFTPRLSESLDDRNPPYRSQPWSQSRSKPPLSTSKSRLTSSPLQQEPGSAQYLTRLLRLAQSPLVPSAKPHMADFLASFNLQEHNPSQLDSGPYGSIDEVQSRLRDIFSSKVSATRAERITTNLEVAGTAQLTLRFSEGDNDALEGLNNIDPSLGGVHSTSIERLAGQAARVVQASEALTNQPHDDPALQRSIAKYIITGVSAIDGSEWIVREVSRATQGWTFTYICKGSFQHWNRQNKTQTKAVICEYSQRELDPHLSCRPAFDCRGTVLICFGRSSRVISIKYDHIPLHQTVAQLALRFKPPAARNPLPGIEKQKTPKQPGSARKKRDTDKAQDENGKPRKRKRKTGDANLPEGSGIANQGEPSQLGDNTMGAGNGGDEQLRVLADNGSTAQQVQARQDASVGGVLAINVSPEEAARRRNVAMQMLREVGVDPDSLSADQFNIFANQSPDLQKESLNMLVKYGAERLRIVHPGNREGSAPSSTPSTSATPVQTSIETSPSGPVTTNELALQTQGTASTKKNGRKSLTNGSNRRKSAVDAESGQQTENSKSRRRGPAKSRLACLACKQRKVKCPREMPTCTECQTAGLICEYPPPKSKKMKSNAIITAEDEQDDDVQEQEQEQEEEEEEQPEPEPESQEDQMQEEEEEYSEMQDNSVYSQMPVANMLTNNINVTGWGGNDVQTTYFQPSSSPSVPEPNPPRQSRQTSSSTSNLILPQGQMYYPSHVSTAEPHQEPVPQTISPKQKSTLTQPTADARYGMSTRSSQKRNQQSPPMNSTITPDWPSSSHSVTQAATATVMAPSMPDQSSGESSYGMGVDSTRAQRGIWHAAALSQAALSQAALEDPQQSHVITSQQQTMATAPIQRHGAISPMADTSRAKSWQGKHMSRNSFHNTSVAETNQAPAASNQQSNSHVQTQQTAVNMNTATSYSNYDRYSDNRASTNTTSESRITYEPYSYQRDTNNTTYGTYDNTHVTTTASMPSQTKTAMAPSNQSSTRQYTSYSASQTQNTSHINTAPYASSRSNSQDLSSDQSRTSRQNFNMRPHTQSSRTNQGSRKPERSYSPFSPHNLQQQQQQQYQQQQHIRQPLPQQPQPQQQQQHNQQPTQHHGWYAFNSQGNNSFASSGNQASSYSWGISGDS